MRISILTLGCKANQAESSQIEAGFLAEGHKIVDLSEGPDLCIVNSCSVTSKSDYQSRQLVRRASRAGARVVVTGCYSELNREQVLSLDGVAKVVGNNEKSNIVKEITGKTQDISLSYPLSGRSRFSMKVQDGCNYACTYCIIPKARGRSRSIPIEDLLRQAVVVSERYSELVLTGIHLGLYGYDSQPQVRLADLVRALLEKTKIGRIRLSSLEINEIDEAILDLLQDGRVCNHLHVPLQSGDDSVLGRMRRTYDSKRFTSGIERIHKANPAVSLGTDVIVGFPGEGEREFENTRMLLDSLPFSYFHVFPYSRRPGTEAAEMIPQLDRKSTRERSARLIALGKKKKQAFLKSQVGKILDPLIEEESEDGWCIGTTANYLKVRASLKEPVIGSIVDVTITGHQGEALIGYLNSVF